LGLAIIQISVGYLNWRRILIYQAPNSSAILSFLKLSKGINSLRNNIISNFQNTWLLTSCMHFKVTTLYGHCYKSFTESPFNSLTIFILMSSSDTK